MTNNSRERLLQAARGVHTARHMRLRRLSTSALFFPVLALACNDNTPSYPAIIIYESPDGVMGTGNTGNTGNTGTGNTGNTSASGGSGNTSSGGASNGGAGSGLFAHCSQPWSGEDPPVGKVECDMDALTPDGDLIGDVTSNRTLTSGHSTC